MSPRYRRIRIVGAHTHNMHMYNNNNHNNIMCVCVCSFARRVHSTPPGRWSSPLLFTRRRKTRCQGLLFLRLASRDVSSQPAAVTTAKVSLFFFFGRTGRRRRAVACRGNRFGRKRGGGGSLFIAAPPPPPPPTPSMVLISLSLSLSARSMRHETGGRSCFICPLSAALTSLSSRCCIGLSP